MKQSKLNHNSGQDVSSEEVKTQALSEDGLIFGMTVEAAHKYWGARAELDEFFLLLEELSSLIAAFRDTPDVELKLRAECLGQLASFLEYQVICSRNRLNSDFASTADVRDALEQVRQANFDKGGVQ